MDKGYRGEERRNDESPGRRAQQYMQYLEHVKAQVNVLLR